jgi:protein-arginine kinase activator protein McsA
MKKIVRLTESDLTRLVKRVINEQSSKPEEDVKNFCKQNNIPYEQDYKVPNYKHCKKNFGDYIVEIIVDTIVGDVSFEVYKQNGEIVDNASKIENMKKQICTAVNQEKYEDAYYLLINLKGLKPKSTQEKYFASKNYSADNWNFEEFKKLIQPYIK